MYQAGPQGFICQEKGLWMILAILFLYICKKKNVKVSDVKIVGKNGHASLASKVETLESQDC